MILLGLVVAGGSATALVSAVPSLPERDAADAGILVVALGIGLGIGAAAMTQSLSVIVFDGELTIRLTPFYRRRIRIEAIVQITEDVIDATRYGGLGVRRAPNSPLAIFQRGGPAARIELVDGSTLLVECADVRGLRGAVGLR